MRLEFRVLWFENQPQDVKTQVEEIVEYVEEAGFVPIIDMREDGSDIDALSEEQQRYNEYDLVVVDFDLGNAEMNGDHVAELVRNGFGFTDIIFYSGQKTADLRKMVHDRKIDGVYCLERPKLAEKLGVHIDQAVLRLSRLEGMRGLAMGTVGKCDDLLRGHIKSSISAMSENDQRTWIAMLDGFVENGAKTSADKYSQCGTIEEKLECRAVTSFHLQKLMLALTKVRPACKGHRDVLKRYDAEVLSPRNTLGHALETRGEWGWEVSSNGQSAISRDDFPKLRKSMAVHLENIRGLGGVLEPERAEQP